MTLYHEDYVISKEERRTLIVMKMRERKKQIVVVRELNITSGAVRYVWINYLNTGTTSDNPRSRRPLKTTENDRRVIC